MQTGIRKLLGQLQDLGPIGAKIGIFQATPLQSSTGADATNTEYTKS